MRKCKYCGSELRAKARFCGHCGKRVDDETEAITNVDDSPVVDIPVPPLTTTFGELQDSASENDVEEEEQLSQLVLDSDVDEEVIEPLPQRKLEDNRENEEQQPQLAFENEEKEQQVQQIAYEDDMEEEEHLSWLALEDDVEEVRTENPESSNSTPGDLYAEQEMPVTGSQSRGTAGDHKGPPSHSLRPSTLREGISAGELESPDDRSFDEHLELDQSSGKLAALSPSVSAPSVRARSSSVPKVPLILLTIFIIGAGCVAALIGLFRVHLPGTSGATNTLSSSAVSEIVNTAGPPLDATICASPSTPGTPGTSDGTGLTLSTPSGCSSFATATATSLCLIFHDNAGGLHKYILNVTNVMVDSKAYHLVLGIAAYTGSASYNDVEHVSVGIGDGSTGENFSWLYRSGNVTIKSNELTGTMDVILGPVSGGNTVHVVGSWTCGRLIKN